ncbi:metal-sensing transcriptional repressor [Candidatus Peregrinibacteria bacterium]|nr:MAG: metal-sensing transcriptional repressor [Candidatus Peregrinibacteria bacterium]
MSEKKQKTAIALKKAHTLLGKILQMVEGDVYCINIIQQNLAVIGLLKSVNLDLLEGHLHCCVKSAMKAQDIQKMDEMMEEILKIMKTAQSK